MGTRQSEEKREASDSALEDRTERMNLSEDQWEALKEAIDSLENLTTALVSLTMMRDSLHVEALRGALPKVLSEMKAVVEAVDA
jgi:hypothetical protein